MYVSWTGLRHALRLVDSLTGLDDPGGFAGLALPGLSRLVGCDSLSFTVLGSKPGQVSVTRHPDGVSPPGCDLVFAAYVHEHPLVNHYQQSGDARPVMISDFLSRQEFQRLNLYGEYFRWMSVEYQIAFGLPVAGPEFIGIALNRAGSDFTQDERDLLNVVRLPLVSALERARQRRRARDRVAAASASSASGALAGVAGVAGVADFTEISDPEDLRELRGLRGLRDLQDLTDREIRVLRLAALGHTNSAIAHALDISPRTVAKHLEHIYRKLDVNSRTSAVFAALADRSPGMRTLAGLPVQ